MRRNDTCIDIEVADERLLPALAKLPDTCRSINPFLRCTVDFQDPQKIESRLLSRISDIAISSGVASKKRKIVCVAAGGYFIAWRAESSSDPKREWIVGLILDMLKQNDVHGG